MLPVGHELRHTLIMNTAAITVITNAHRICLMIMSVCVVRDSLVVAVRLLLIPVSPGPAKMELTVAKSLAMTTSAPALKILTYVPLRKLALN